MENSSTDPKLQWVGKPFHGAFLNYQGNVACQSQETSPSVLPDPEST